MFEKHVILSDYGSDINYYNVELNTGCYLIPTYFRCSWNVRLKVRDDARFGNYTNLCWKTNWTGFRELDNGWYKIAPFSIFQPSINELRHYIFEANRPFVKASFTFIKNDGTIVEIPVVTYENYMRETEWVEFNGGSPVDEKYALAQWVKACQRKSFRLIQSE